MPSLWFWRLVVGVDDVPLGGWIYVQVFKSLRRDIRVDRKGPMTLDMPNRIVSGQNGDGPRSIWVSCDAVIGFFSLTSRRSRMGADGVRVVIRRLRGGWALRLTAPLSKTDQYNEGRSKELRGARR